MLGGVAHGAVTNGQCSAGCQAAALPDRRVFVALACAEGVCCCLAAVGLKVQAVVQGLPFEGRRGEVLGGRATALQGGGGWQSRSEHVSLRQRHMAGGECHRQ